MEKKIIAVACALLTLVLAFTACGKATVTGDNGIEYEAVTDEEGNTVVNENGEIVVYVTDADGNYIEDEDGEPQTNVIDFPSVIVDGDTVETADFKLTVPEGWTVDSDGKCVRNDDAGTSIEIALSRAFTEGETIDTVFAKQQERAERIVKAIQQNYPNTTVTYSDDVQLTSSQLPCRAINTTIRDENGTLLRHTVDLLLTCGETLYFINYLSATETYDSEFDILAFLDENMTIK